MNIKKWGHSNGQHNLQKQSFNMLADMTYKQENENLMRDIPIYDGKNMH